MFTKTYIAIWVLAEVPFSVFFFFPSYIIMFLSPRTSSWPCQDEESGKGDTWNLITAPDRGSTRPPRWTGVVCPTVSQGPSFDWIVFVGGDGGIEDLMSGLAST